MAGAPHRLSFCMPQVVVTAHEFPPQPGSDTLVVAFCTNQGEFALQLFLKP
jgi:hypothetical protein